MKKKFSKIMVIGSGAWGTALANHLALNNFDVYINSRNQNIVNEINLKNQNSKYLPSLILSKNISSGSVFKTDVDFVFIVVPSANADLVFAKIAKENFKKDCIFVICSKGFSSQNNDLLSDSFEKIVGTENYAVLSGPNFAIEVANQQPTVTSIASKNKKVAQKIIKILNNRNFKALYFKDPRTTEICGIVKNILAIGCGMVDGFELGVNAKSALIIKGIEEIKLICKAIKSSTYIAHPAGFGDIFLTCSSDKSRNNSLGVLIAQGKEIDKTITYEGISSAQNIIKLAKKHKLKLDLCEVIAKIIEEKKPNTDAKSLIIKAILS